MSQPIPDYLVGRIRYLSTPLEPCPTDVAPQLDPLPGIRAVLFDVYGTLVISASGDIGLAGERDTTSAFAAALDAAGIRAPATAGPARLEQAIRASHTQRQAAGTEFPEVDILAVWAEVLGGEVPASQDKLARLAVEYECRVNPVWPMPGLARLLADLRRRPLVLGIVSNAQFYTPLMLEGFLGAPLADLGFDTECCAWSYRLLEAKPSTRIYQVALTGLDRVHGIAPSEVLYVGNDLRNDIWPASLTGCRTALFAGDARSLRLREDDPCCASVVPDRVVTALSQTTDAILPAD
ncbi:HAD family hydrolase [Candidatus Thiosymbion oneisti]|uniref:HAD family hydrolase n=1 Tax=Candidatus Thiosymbion oneisti TaxID=589554 RepID=UPI000A8F9A72|nr:HAD family hydrolase [Candidatus Thiosymbion oneisti]